MRSQGVCCRVSSSSWCLPSPLERAAADASRCRSNFPFGRQPGFELVVACTSPLTALNAFMTSKAAHCVVWRASSTTEAIASTSSGSSLRQQSKGATSAQTPVREALVACLRALFGALMTWASGGPQTWSGSVDASIGSSDSSSDSSCTSLRGSSMGSFGNIKAVSALRTLPHAFFRRSQPLPNRAASAAASLTDGRGRPHSRLNST